MNSEKEVCDGAITKQGKTEDRKLTSSAMRGLLLDAKDVAVKPDFPTWKAAEKGWKQH
jgi:hypothetical protein